MPDYPMIPQAEGADLWRNWLKEVGCDPTTQGNPRLLEGLADGTLSLVRGLHGPWIVRTSDGAPLTSYGDDEWTFDVDPLAYGRGDAAF